MKEEVMADTVPTKIMAGTSGFCCSMEAAGIGEMLLPCF